MLAHVWVFELIRYVGACYLIYLAFCSARTAFKSSKTSVSPIELKSATAAFCRGFAIHITNPKAILFFGALYSIGIPANATAQDLVIVIAAIGLMSFTVFIGYGWVFSVAPVRRLYERLHRWFNGVFAIAFGAVGFKLLTTRIF